MAGACNQGTGRAAARASAGKLRKVGQPQEDAQVLLLDSFPGSEKPNPIENRFDALQARLEWDGEVFRGESLFNTFHALGDLSIPLFEILQD